MSTKPQSNDNLTPEFISDKTLAARYDVTRQTVWLWTRKGKLPKPVKLGEATTRWKLSDLLAWESKQGERA